MEYSDLPEIINNTKSYRKISSVWGSYYVLETPEKEEETLNIDLDSLYLNPDNNKLPKELWRAIVALFYYYSSTNVEAGVTLLRNSMDTSQWKVIVPFQSVSGGSVDCSDAMSGVDILTGEVFDETEQWEWVYAGSSHSHHTMRISWSAVDDADELNRPGMHILVNKMFGYDYCIEASIVQNRCRYNIPEAEQVIEVIKNDPDDLFAYVENTFSNNIKTPTPKGTTKKNKGRKKKANNNTKARITGAVNYTITTVKKSDIVWDDFFHPDCIKAVKEEKVYSAQYYHNHYSPYTYRGRRFVYNDPYHNPHYSNGNSASGKSESAFSSDIYQQILNSEFEKDPLEDLQSLPNFNDPFYVDGGN